MSKYDNMYEIQNAFYNGAYSLPKGQERLSRLPDGHIFDRNKTVAWNEEQLEIHNNKVEEQRAQLKAKEAELDRQLHTDVAEFIRDTYGISDAQAKIIESEAYSDKHSSMPDYFYECTRLAELFCKLMKAN